MNYVGTSTRDGYINKINSFNPEYGIILGSGLGSFTEDIKIEFTLPYNEFLIFLYLQFRDIKGLWFLGLLVIKGSSHARSLSFL
jgi:purine-nucleoside phosphorylase